MKTIRSILNKYGIKLSSDLVEDRSVQDHATIEQLLSKRNNAQKEIINRVMNDEKSLDEVVLHYAKSMTSKQYSRINDTGVEIVWGVGGHQTQRIQKLNKSGTKYIWIKEYE